MTKNIFEATLGVSAIQWGAVMNLLRWLLDAEEGHLLGDSIIDQLMIHSFGAPISPREVKPGEFGLRDEVKAGGKWPDLAVGAPSLNSPSHLILLEDADRRRGREARKLQNLSIYLESSIAQYPGVLIRLVVLTNAHDISAISYLPDHLGPAVESTSASGWKLLPLQTLGSWVRQNGEHSSEPLRSLFTDLVEWTEMVGAKWRTA